jgi:uncharacterized damage-inducible protein DinB
VIPGSGHVSQNDNPEFMLAAVRDFLRAVDGKSAGAAPVTAAAGEGQLMLAQLERRIRTAGDKFIQLAEAVPEDRYDWRPMEGVRSFREVFIHVAADNWAPLWMDVRVPEGTPVTRDAESLSAYQKQHLDKAATLAELRRSFDFILGAVDQTRNRLDGEVTFGGRAWRIDEMWVALATHMHEHLGQTIAYARANRIVPPWSNQSDGR